MTKEKIKEYSHLHFLKNERKDSIEDIKKKIEKETEYFDDKIKHSRGIRREVITDIKNDILASYEDLIEELEHEINVINERLEELRGESK